MIVLNLILTVLNAIRSEKLRYSKIIMCCVSISMFGISIMYM